jgi:hypothetical protein
MLEVAREIVLYHRQKASYINRGQLDPYLQLEWLRSPEAMKAAEVLEPLYKKLNFYEKTLRIDITELTIRDPNKVMHCHAVGEHLAKHLATLQHLRRVNCQTLTSSWFLEQMKNECSQLVSGGGFIDR